MTDIEKVDSFLSDVKVFDFITVDGDKPKGRPFGLHLLYEGKIYFGCGTFKKVYQGMEKNPHAEILAMGKGKFLRYDGKVHFVKDEEVIRRIDR